MVYVFFLSLRTTELGACGQDSVLTQLRVFFVSYLTA